MIDKLQPIEEQITPILKKILTKIIINCLKWFVLIFIVFIPMPVLAQNEPMVNAGLVANGIWYSLDPFFPGDQIRIYSAMQNQAGFDIIGKIQFWVDDKLLTQFDFSVINGRLIEKWADWQATEGDHDISVRIIEPKKVEIGKDPVPITLKFSSIGTGKRFVDLDTDGDRIGNREDPDDDNDGVSDEEEIRLGTNPLSPEPRAAVTPIPEPTEEKAISEKTKEIIEKVIKTLEEKKETLEEKKETIEKEIEEEKEPKPILEELLKEIEKRVPAVGRIPREKMPTWKHVYGWLITILIYILSTLIYILSTPWLLLLIVILVIIWILRKILIQGHK